MKKIIAIASMLISGSVLAASATVEVQSIEGLNNTTNQNSVSLTVKESINNTFAGDLNLIQTNNVSSTSPDKLASTRVEAGVTGTTPLFGSVSAYTRVGVGQKYNSSTNFGYYSVEPGISAALGGGFSAKMGYRFRTAFDDQNNDQTRTARLGVAYAISKQDTVAVRYDRIRGVSQQNAIALNYARGF